MASTDRSNRLDSIDLLRGLVMVVMALDHVKGNFSNLHFDSTDLTKTTTIAFLTRWITHFCAPTFVLLAGVGSYLYGARVQNRTQLAWFLLSRGLWLVVLELTVIRFSWFLNVNYEFAFGQVIWAIGWSMVTLAGLVYLPTSAIAAFGVALIVLHNTFDGVSSQDWGDYGWVWKILHTGEDFEVVPGRRMAPFYPLVPWVGVLAAGYGLGALMRLDPARRRRELLGLGLTLIAAFILLRYGNVYGDKAARSPGTPGPWSVQQSPLFTVFSFVNCQKYPPSLCFLLMTLGPAIVALALFEWAPQSWGRPFVILGRVPMFFYLLHWFLIKLLAIVFAYVRYGRADWLYGGPKPNLGPPEDNGYDLWAVYMIWLFVVALLYPLCYRYAQVKARSRSVWLSYL